MRTVTTLSTAMLAVVLAPAALTAQSPVTGTAELAYRSNYLFAGIPFASNEVTQATISVGAGSFTLNTFASFDHDLSTVNEADIYGDYYRQLSPTVGAFVGAALYNFKIDGEWDGTPELYAGLVLSTLLTPTLYVSHDFDLGDGTHAVATVSHDVPLASTGASLGFIANLEYNDEYYVETSGFSYANGGVSLSIPIGALTVTPMVLIQMGIGDGFVDDDVFGVSASFGF